MFSNEVSDLLDSNHEGNFVCNDTNGSVEICEETRQDNGDGHFQSFVFNFCNNRDAEGNLQDAFIKYQKQRQKEMKRMRKRRDIPGEVRLRSQADPDRMWRLRMKFLNQAKKYFGTPYAKKYWTPNDPEYHCARFLDCCGLIRQILRDLKKDFGFRIGPWNQSYLCDTLPIIVGNEEDMKPGDLVFISAIYHNQKMKKQKHNLTHVEIWLGEGCKTIGARWQRGKVQVFDSYQFDATSYHSPVYIFKSIDTWLMGICRSHCPEHTWKLRSEAFTPGKKSIFYANPEFNQNQGHEEDEGAGGSDDEDSISNSQEPKSTDITQGFKDFDRNSLSEISILSRDDVNLGENVGAVTEFASSCDRQNLDRNELEHVCKLADRNRSPDCCNGCELHYCCKSFEEVTADCEESHDLQINSLSNHENDHVNLNSLNVFNISLCDKSDNELQNLK